MKVKILFLAAMISAMPGALAGSMRDLSNLGLAHIKIPYYDDQKLKLIIFSSAGRRQNELMLSERTFLDLLKENVDVDKIPDGWDEKLYPLKSSLPEILKFWKTRWKISEAVIFSKNCVINQPQSEASGDDPVFLRSPMFDLDGIGFKANFQSQVIEVNGDVRIILRSADSDPRKIFDGSPIPKEYKVVSATSDSLRLDQKNNEVMLIGNVRVVDGRNILTCDRLTVFMKPRDSESKSAGEVLPSKDEKAVISGISRVLADGDVVLDQYPEDPAKNATELQTSRSEHLEYEVDQERIILTGEESDPRLTRGTDTRLTGKRIELLRHEDKVFVTRDCRINSLVRNVNGTVSHVRSIRSERANFDGKSSVANFHGKVTASDKTTTLDTDSLRVHMIRDERTGSQKIRLLFGSGNVKIVSREEKDVPGKPGKKSVSTSTVTSRQAELNYEKNKMVFYNDVKVRDDSAALDCDRLDIYLTDRKPTEHAGKKDASSAPAGNPLAAGMEGQDKTITKMTANGKVFMMSKENELHTDLLTLFFRDLPPGVKPSPGMFQSGGVQLIKILCDGSVLAVAKKKASAAGKTAEERTLKSANAMSDLLADYSEFHGDVSIQDGPTEIHCRDMYIFTKAPPPAPGKTTEKTPQKTPEASLDDDPFAVDMGENSVPSRIAISDKQDIKRIVCKKEVVLLRRGKDNKLQRAGGDQAVYTVDTKEVVLSAERPRRPWLRGDGRKQFCDLIRSDIATGDLRSIGNVEVMPDDENNNPPVHP